VVSAEVLVALAWTVHTREKALKGKSVILQWDFVRVRICLN
jgi:hypothetical protein